MLHNNAQHFQEIPYQRYPLIPDDFQNVQCYDVPAEVIKTYRADRGRGSNGLSLLEPLDKNQKYKLAERKKLLPEEKYPFDFKFQYQNRK